MQKNYVILIKKLLMSYFSERELAIRIAQAYKEEYERVNIDDKDIEYLHNTLVKVIELLFSFSGTNTAEQENLLKLVGLLNKDT